MAEVGESSGAKPCEEFWAKLVPSYSRYPDVEISSYEIVACSEILVLKVVRRRLAPRWMKKLIIHQIHALNLVLYMVGSAAIKPLSICNVKHAEE
ncbi:unnamed protein product [Malus baccata var. baccata]